MRLPRYSCLFQKMFGNKENKEANRRWKLKQQAQKQIEENIQKRANRIHLVRGEKLREQEESKLDQIIEDIKAQNEEKAKKKVRTDQYNNFYKHGNYDTINSEHTENVKALKRYNQYKNRNMTHLYYRDGYLSGIRNVLGITPTDQITEDKKLSDKVNKVTSEKSKFRKFMDENLMFPDETPIETFGHRNDFDLKQEYINTHEPDHIPSKPKKKSILDKIKGWFRKEDSNNTESTDKKKQQSPAASKPTETVQKPESIPELVNTNKPLETPIEPEKSIVKVQEVIPEEKPTVDRSRRKKIIQERRKRMKKGSKTIVEDGFFKKHKGKLITGGVLAAGGLTALGINSSKKNDSSSI